MSRDRTSPLEPFTVIESRARRRTLIMWASIAVCLFVLVVLLAAGFGDRAWSIAAVLLMLSCFAVCGWAGYSSERDIDRVIEAAKRFDAERQRDGEHHDTPPPTQLTTSDLPWRQR
jgi:hypothetical protein